MPPSCRLDGLSLPAVFEPSSPQTLVPDSCVVPASGLSLVTVQSLGSRFSCVIAVKKHARPEVWLGIDWFSTYREQFILNGEHPPSAQSFVLSPLAEDEGTSASC
jgi:hypothetical protein